MNRKALFAILLCAGCPLAFAADAGTTRQSAPYAAVDPSAAFHFAGYADATYGNSRDGGGFGAVTFNPILHVQWRDRLLLEAEMESAVDDAGEAEANLEYASISWLLNDYAALVAGKFLSPTGYFFQNLHPSWINKLPSAPAGFGHGGAAPLTDFGAQLRGGRTSGSGQHVNYAVFVSNGPRLGREEDALDLDTEGSTSNADGERVYGGRLGWMPRPELELGVSLARGRVQLAGGSGEPMARIAKREAAESAEPSRAYQVDGVDLAWRPFKGIDMRAEWIRQRVGAAGASALPDRATWRAWYSQCAYRFGGDRWEAVARYGESRSPHEESTFDQLALGLNYLLAPQAQIKLAWEFNDSEFEEAAADRLLLQFAYGF